jgi:hypothetical protein
MRKPQAVSDSYGLAYINTVIMDIPYIFVCFVKWMSSFTFPHFWDMLTCPLILLNGSVTIVIPLTVNLFSEFGW